MFRLFLLFFIFGLVSVLHAQTPRCGYPYLQNEFIKRGFTIRYDTMPVSVQKTTATTADTIPVVFHFSLTQSQFKFFRTLDTLEQYIDSQMAILNADFNSQNRDSVNIPAAFQPLRGRSDIYFALAHTAPDGSASPGYELDTITKNGFELDGGAGSGIGFSSAKYAAGGGQDAWDPATYLNIWIINPLDGGSPTNILGLTISPGFGDYYGMPDNERGVILQYKVWDDTLASVHGRTLTHEMGHYFGLRHVWGDDDGKCAFNGGEDDGIDDTPQQAYPSYRCPKFPQRDNCSPDSPGYMFMNFMDYSDDNCLLMFTHGQASSMKASLSVFGNAYTLTQHPEVLAYPAGAADRNTYVIYPNPAPGMVNVRFRRTPEGVKHFHVKNTLGKIVVDMPVTDQRGLYMLDMGHLASGIYFLEVWIGDTVKTEKIVLNN